MVTKYIKVKAQFDIRDKSTNQPLDIKITSAQFSDLNSSLAKHLLLNGVINLHAFQWTGNLCRDDLISYYEPEQNDGVTSIAPYYLGVEGSGPFVKDENEELHPYLYIKVMSETPVECPALDNLLEYISGQLSDGWGEGFEQHSMTLYSNFDCRYVKVYVSFDWHVETFEITDNVTRMMA